MTDKVYQARKLRRNPTGAEKKLWYALRNRQLLGQKFRRQYPIRRYVVDFCCFEKQLVIEVDGGQHSQESAKDNDRTAEIEKEGFRVIRFWNHDVLQNIEGVLSIIANAIKSPSPQPSPKGRGNNLGESRDH